MLSSLNAPILLPPKEKLNTIISCHQQLLLQSVAQWPQSLNHTTSLLSPQTEGATVSWIQRLLLKRLAWLLGFFLSGLDSALHIRRRTKKNPKKHWQHFLRTSFRFGRRHATHCWDQRPATGWSRAANIVSCTKMENLRSNSLAALTNKLHYYDIIKSASVADRRFTHSHAKSCFQ